MDSKVFRARATYAVDLVAKFTEEFPDVFCIMRLGDKSSDMEVVVGTVEKKSEIKDDEDDTDDED